MYHIICDVEVYGICGLWVGRFNANGKQLQMCDKTKLERSVRRNAITSMPVCVCVCVCAVQSINKTKTKATQQQIETHRYTSWDDNVRWSVSKKRLRIIESIIIWFFWMNLFLGLCETVTANHNHIVSGATSATLAYILLRTVSNVHSLSRPSHFIRLSHIVNFTSTKATQQQHNDENK